MVRRSWYNFFMERVTVLSPAKVNLSLHINGVQGGFHMIESLVTTVDLCDKITARRRSDGQIVLHMHGEGSESIPFQDNNAVRAAQLFMHKFSAGGADITVEKRIPIGAGLGGSSADAAGVLNALCALYEKKLASVEDIADAVGSDTRYMLCGGWAVISGRGNCIADVNTSLRPWFVILVPQGSVSAGQCYRVYDSIERGACVSNTALSAAENNDFNGLCAGLYNALYAPAKIILPEVEGALKDALTISPAACMSGSGSAVFALFENRAVAQKAYSAYRGSCRAFLAGTCLPRTLQGE